MLEDRSRSAQEQMWRNFATDRPLSENVGDAAELNMLAGLATVAEPPSGFAPTPCWMTRSVR